MVKINFINIKIMHAEDMRVIY